MSSFARKAAVALTATAISILTIVGPAYADDPTGTASVGEHGAVVPTFPGDTPIGTTTDEPIEAIPGIDTTPGPGPLEDQVPSPNLETRIYSAEGTRIYSGESASPSPSPSPMRDTEKADGEKNDTADTDAAKDSAVPGAAENVGVPQADGTRFFGFNTESVEREPAAKLQATFSAPASASLLKYALPAGNQGLVGSCVTWATGYGAYGILMNEQGIKGAPMAPMFLYSQIVREYNGGADRGTTGGIASKMLQERGITTQANWGPSTTNFRTLPTQAQLEYAKQFKLSNFRNLRQYSDVKGAVMDAISKGHPVPIGFYIRPSFNQTKLTGKYNPSPGEPAQGGHEVLVVAYDQNGVVIQNSWGGNWGNKGFFTAPWSWLVNPNEVMEIHSMHGVRKDVDPNPVPPQPKPTPPAPPKPGPVGENVVVNPSFEDGTAGWRGQTHMITSKGYTAKTGKFKTWMGGFGYKAVERLAQDVAIPQAGKATMSLALKTLTDETDSKPIDKLYIFVIDAQTKKGETLAMYSNVDKSDDYVIKNIDMSKYVGKTVQIQFAVSENDKLQTSFLVDDVSVIASN